MKEVFCTRRLLVVLLTVLTGAGTQNSTFAGMKDRRTKIVVAVEKTRPSVVMVKVKKRGRWSTKEIVGTGIIVDERGFLITNHHVIDRGVSIEVRLPDGTTTRANVFKDVPESDLAILRIHTKKKLEALSFAPASDLMVGERIIAIGHPYGYAYTVSRGIISSLGRKVEMPNGYTLTNLIQHDASINPGNSGGPLLNIDGELIGVNVALRDGARGIAFALNADTVQKVLSKYLSARKIAKVGHGLKCHEVVKTNPKDGYRQRVVVDQVVSSSPASRAGVRRGDVIVKVGQRAITNRFDLERSLWSYQEGDRVQAHILREGKIRAVSFTLSGN